MSDKIDSLIKKLKDSNIEEQIDIVNKLAETKSRKTIKPLLDLLDSSLGKWAERPLVSSIVKALGQLKAKEAQDVLLKALNSNLFFVKTQAAEEMGNVVLDEKTIKKLDSVLHSKESKELKKKVIKGLGKKKKKKVVKPLAEVVEGDFSEEVKEEAIDALGKTEQREAATPLILYYYEEANEKLRRDILKAISNIATISSIDVLIQALGDKNYEIRACAALALGKVRSKMGEVPLKRLLSDPIEDVRENAAKALGLITFLPYQG